MTNSEQLAEQEVTVDNLLSLFERAFIKAERDEDDEAFVSCESIVAWAPFQRIDEEHKEKNC